MNDIDLIAVIILCVLFAIALKIGKDTVQAMLLFALFIVAICLIILIGSVLL